MSKRELTHGFSVTASAIASGVDLGEFKSVMHLSRRLWSWQLLASSVILGGVSAFSGSPIKAQIVPDTTLGAESSVVTPQAPDSSVNVIQGGAKRDANLFHSFEQFSVPTGGTAYFNNALNIQNIFSRVTGRSISNIDGLIQANGSANLFLLNPNGIIFGPNASLNIGGSFVGSTASSLNFADGTQFSASHPQTTPLLTVSVPLGLQFGGSVGRISNQSVAVDRNGIPLPVGLQVQPRKTLALVGGDVALYGGYLTAEEGRIELGSVGSNSLVSLAPTEQGWVLGYEGVQNFHDIQLSQTDVVVFDNLLQGASVDGGDIQVRGRQITLTGNSGIWFTTNLGVTASELVELSNSDLSSTLTSNAGTPSGLTITTGKLIVRDGASVSIEPISSASAGGNLTVTASESVEVIGTDANENPSKLFTYTSLPSQIFQVGDGGDLTIETRQLNVRDRAEVATSTYNAGDAGELIVRASNSVEVSGGGRILAQTEVESTGAGGNLTIETERLQGTQLVVRSFGQGPAGKLTVITPAPLPNLEAQILPDETLPNNSTVRSDFNTSIIEGGTQVGSNLFHSFTQFSTPTLSTAYFNNALDVQNIISRVTGSSASNIDGQIQANGNANLFLLNPNGISFGRDAFLNIGGSFLGSTATSLDFADNTQFSAQALQTTPQLTVSVPIGLQFSGTAGSILNQSGVNSFGSGLGLRVQPGETLALVGGDVKLDRGRLTAPGGRVELGGLAGAGMVEFQGNGSNLSLSFPEGVVRADVTITNEGAPESTNIYTSAGVDVAGSDGGSIAINARNIDIIGQFSILSAGINGNLALPNAKAGDITLNATEMITISQSSRIFNNQGGANGSPGNISMQAKDSIFVADSFISNILFGGVLTESRFLPSGNKENSGNVSIQANGSVSIKNSSILNLIYLGYGNIGNVSVQANDSVSLANSSISTTTFGQGNSGDITVQTNALRILDGAGLSATTRGEGDGGNMTVNVNTLEITGGGQLRTTAFSSGNAGSITVNAIDSIILSGSDPDLPDKIDYLNGIGLVSPASGLFANTTEGSTGQAGSLRIETGRLNIQDGAEVNVSSAGAGAAGNLTVLAGSIRLDNQSSIQATTAAGDRGNISLRSQDLVLDHGSDITTNATGTATGGNITINTGFIIAAENSDITANAQDAKGGQIRINAQGIFGTGFRDTPTLESDITASSNLGPDFSGTVQINTPDANPSQGLVTLPTNLVDASGLIAQSCRESGRATASEQNQFIVTGRGGLPPSPSEALSSQAVWQDLRPPVRQVASRSSREVSSSDSDVKITSGPSSPIVEAQGWVINNKGEVVLTATAPSVTPHIPWLTPATCQTPQKTS